MPSNGQHKSTSAAAAIDVTALEKFQAQFGADGPELMPQLINLFLKDAPKLIVQMRQGAIQGDAKTLHRSAHSLKSNSETFGAFKLSALCANLETHTKAGTVEGVEVMVAHIQEEFNRAQTKLRHYTCTD
jgi:HPt (histidine-containing phosphotransfer) domain-containing protein